MCRRLLGLIFLVVLAWQAPATGQILGTGVLPVTEIGPNLTNGLITSIQSTITAIEAVIQSAYMLLELTPLDEIALSGEFTDTMAELGALAEEGAGLIHDAEAAAADFDALFGLEGIPTTPQELSERVAQTRQVIYEAHRYAIRVQSLIAHISSAVRHVNRIVDLVGVLVGNMQGNQLSAQLLAQANQTLQTQTLQQAAMQRAQILESAERRVIVLSWNRIHCEQWSDWPGFQGCD
jgi:hypothetical protein